MPIPRFVQGLALVALLVGGIWPVGADHPQSYGAVTTTFDHRGGNEWWVEVRVDGGDIYVVHAIESDGNSMALQLNDWGNYVGSMHIEPGHSIRFAANARDGSPARESCWFTHPAGVEQCTTTPPPPPTSSFDATFTLVTGNGYWVQAQVTPNSGFTVATVDVRLNDGAWKPLKLQSWGVRAWAASYPIPEGTVVQMRATATTAASDLSECYRWIPPTSSGQNAATVACGSTPPPPPPPTAWRSDPRATFVESLYDISVGDADRDGKGETYVAGSEGLFKVTPLGRTAISPLIEWVYVAVGDADNDGQAEVYATRGTGGPAPELHRLSYSGTVWTDIVIYSAPHSIGPLTLGDLDYDGKREIYLGEAAGQNATVTQVRHDGTTWQSQRIVDLGNDGRFLGLSDLWVGDGDRDGKPELAATTGGYGYSLVWLIEKGATGWTATRLGSFSDSPQGVVAGDVDGDGLGEVVAANQGGSLFQYRFVSGAWQTQEIQVVPYGTSDIFLGDGDDDGKPEIYAASSNGELYQVRQTPGAFTTTSIALHNAGGHQYGPNIVVVGDGDGDGKREIYTDLFDLAGRTTTLYETQVATTPPPPPPPPGNFGAAFTMVQGNVWWQQAQVTPSGQALSKVDLSLNGGAWQPLKLQTWGVRQYAGSYYAVQGTIVQLRATSTTGATALSSCYQWIPASGQDATQVACGSAPPPPPPPPPSGFDATFSGVKGNDWWVQANVAANQPLAGVDVRVNCAASWKPLTKQSWGGWTASFNIPAGSKVDFAARSTSGAADASGGYTWPQATATSGCAFGVWPQQGSFATYNLHHTVGGDGRVFVTDARLNLAYNNGAWTGICTGRSTTFYSDPETSTDWTATVTGQPPMKLPAATSVGATHNLAYFFPSFDGHTCDLDTNTDSDFRPVTVQRQEDRATSMQDSTGAPITLRAWYADHRVDAERNYVVAWDTKLGLVLDWNVSGRGSHGGELVATDAPVR